MYNTIKPVIQAFFVQNLQSSSNKKSSLITAFFIHLLDTLRSLTNDM